MPDQTEAEVLSADDRRFEAMRKADWPALEAVLADDLTYVHSTARLETKAEHVGNLKAGKPHYRGIAPRERKVRVHGGVGVVNGVSEMHVENAGKEQRFTVRYLAVYAKAGQRLADDRLAVHAGARRLAEPGRMTTRADRESIADATNPLGLDGIEFIEYATSKPQALGQVLEMMGFRPIARHRSREVLLYRQGDMNVIVNAHVAAACRARCSPTETPVIAAIALRVRDAAAAYRHALDRGAWAVPTHVEVMELNIPAIHGVGTSRIYFVDRYHDFSIYDVDFMPIPTVDPHPPALTGLHWFGVVQYIGNDRMEDWTEFYRELFGFEPLPDEQRFGILPKGRILRSPCAQLLPAADRARARHPRRRAATSRCSASASARPTCWPRSPRCASAASSFVESRGVHSEARGALTQQLPRRRDVRARATTDGAERADHEPVHR